MDKNSLTIKSVELFRTVLLARAYLLIGILGAVLFIYNIWAIHSYTLGMIELSKAVFSLLLYILIKHHHYRQWYRICYLVFILSGVYYASYIIPINDGVFMWGFCIPIYTYPLMGSVGAGFISFFSLGYYLRQIIHLSDVFILHPPLDAVVNYSVIYIAIWASAHIYEQHRLKSESLLFDVATTDPLTGVKNRYFFEPQCRQLLSYKQNFFLLLLDIDHFKQINDTYGHEAGDQVLRQVGRLLLRFFGENCVFRYGGEEFCILLSDCEKSIALQQAEQIRAMFASETIIIDEIPLTITVSIGMASSMQSLSLEGLISLADNFMYQAKTAGRNCVVWA